MKGIKVAIIIFSALCVLTALFSIAGFAIYFYYGAILTGVNAVAVLILLLIRRRKIKASEVL